jgi:hypothetical protein
MAMIFLTTILRDGFDWAAVAIAAAFGVAGVGQLGYVRATLPRWAEERAAQMEALAERIPLLLKEQ